MNNTMLCLEVDENHHTYYIKADEIIDTMIYLWILVGSVYSSGTIQINMLIDIIRVRTHFSQ